MKNDMYVVLSTTSHHGGSGSFRCSCSQTVGVTPENIHLSASAWKCQRVGRPIRSAAPRLKSYSTSTSANGSQSRMT